MRICSHSTSGDQEESFRVRVILIPAASEYLWRSLDPDEIRSTDKRVSELWFHKIPSSKRQMKNDVDSVTMTDIMIWYSDFPSELKRWSSI